MTARSGPPETDKFGHEIGEYPQNREEGSLLGFNVFGHAVYATDERAVLAVLGPSGDLRIPPRERWFAGAFPLADVGLTPGDYVLYAADEGGPWRALAPFGREAVGERGVEPSEVLRDAAATGDPDVLVPTVVNDTESTDRIAAAGELRELVVDDPEAVQGYVRPLLEWLTGTPGANATADESFDRFAAATDVAFVVARVARSAPDTVLDAFDPLVGCLGSDRETADVPDYLASLLDALDVVGRQQPDATADALRVRIGGTDSDRAVSALNALYRLEHRYADGSHPLLDHESVREVVAQQTTGTATEVHDAAAAVETIHEFHRRG